MKKKMKQSKMSALLGIGSIILLILVITFCIWNEASTIATRRGLNNKHELVMMAYQLRDGSQYLTSEVRAYSANGEQLHYDNYWNEVNNAKRRDKALERMREIGLHSSEEQQIQAVLDLSNSLIPLEEQAMEAVQKGDNATALGLMYGDEYSDGISKIGTMTETFINMLSSRSSAEVEALAESQGLVFFIMLLIILGVAVFQVLSICVVKYRILKPMSLICNAMGSIAHGDLSCTLALEPDTSEIGQLTDAVLRTKNTLAQYIHEISSLLQEMAKGNLNLSIQGEYVGDFSAIKAAFEKILNDLNRTFSKINGASGLVADSAGQVSANAQTLAQGSTQQAAAVDDLKDTVTIISQHVHGTAGNAHQADQLASTVGSEIERCNQMMRQSISAMDEINRAANQIGTIIKTIDDIAFQTNILALNAAVEAARAGAAGKGFAVVADEVRNLAIKSAAAASDTTGLIDSAIGSVKKGTGLVDDAAQVLLGIVGNAHTVVESIQQITEASSAQAKSLSEVSEGMAQIASVVSTNSATAEESAAASEELSGQADTLHELMSHFNLRDSIPAASLKPALHS